MAVATAPQLLTYEDYMAEGEVTLHYDIVDGVRFVTNPTRQHNSIAFRLAKQFDQYAESRQTCCVLTAPCDVLIRQKPLRVRQPDLSLITRERLSQCPAEDNPAPLPIGPELVVEVLSPSDTPSVLAGKLEDFRAAGVEECWVVAPGSRTVEVLRFSGTETLSAGRYREADEVSSRVFPGLKVPVSAVFAEAY